MIVHSGSRNAGHVIANHYQQLAGKNRESDIPRELAWLSGQAAQDYLHDMEILNAYASWNRRAIADEILGGMKWKAKERFETIHNYIDIPNRILRKGAKSAQKGERMLIPFNMRDGSMVCEGLGNPEWNYSAPHGAGRAFGRQDALARLTLTEYKRDMKGIYTICISRNTLDESPGAYKRPDEIISQVGDTVKIISYLKPVYNYKAGGE